MGGLTIRLGRLRGTWTGSYEGGILAHQIAADHGIITENQSHWLPRRPEQ